MDNNDIYNENLKVWTLHKLPKLLGYKHSWVLADPEVRKRLEGANWRMDQAHLRKMQVMSFEINYDISIKHLLHAAGTFRKREPGKNGPETGMGHIHNISVN